MNITLDGKRELRLAISWLWVGIIPDYLAKANVSIGFLKKIEEGKGKCGSDVKREQLNGPFLALSREGG